MKAMKRENESNIDKAQNDTNQNTINIQIFPETIKDLISNN